MEINVYNECTLPVQLDYNWVLGSSKVSGKKPVNKQSEK